MRKLKNIGILFILIFIGFKDVIKIYTVYTEATLHPQISKYEFRNSSLVNDFGLPQIPDLIKDNECEEDEVLSKDEVEDTNSFLNTRRLIAKRNFKSYKLLKDLILFPDRYLLFCSLKLDC